MVSLTDLEPEVASIILELVDETSPDTIKAVACVNRYLNELTKLIAHRHKVVHVNGSLDGPLVDTIQSWIDDSTTLATIRTLTVTGWLDRIASDFAQQFEPGAEFDSDHEHGHRASKSQARNEYWAPVVTLVSKIGRLQQLNWSIRQPLPVALLDALENNQTGSTLRIYKFIRSVRSAPYPELMELRLARSPALTHIRYDGRSNFINLPDLQKLAFQAIVSSAPNLEYAGMLLLADIPPLFPPGRNEYEPVLLVGKKPPNPAVKQLTLDGYSTSRPALHEWSRIIDLGKLENLKFSRGLPTLDCFQHAMDMLPNLKHLSLNFRSVVDSRDDPEKTNLVMAIQNYIENCSPLETLSLWSWMSVVPLSAILQRHGATLQTLQLHERETTESNGRLALSVAEVVSIGTRCPNLRHLTFDLNRDCATLNRNKDSNRKYYNALARFPHLDSLQIYFDAGTAYLRILEQHTSQDDDFLHEDVESYESEEIEESDESDTGTDCNSDTATYANALTGNTDGDDDNTTTTTTTTTTNAASVSNWQPSRSNSPPAKRFRLISPAPEPVRPSKDSALETYSRRIWNTVFGHKASGPRHLDIKIGEWEARDPFVNLSSENDFRRHLVVRPNDRDDMDGATVRIYHKDTYRR